MFKQLFHTLVIRLLDFFTRRSIGGSLLKYGIVLAVMTLSADFAFQFSSKNNGDGWNFSFATGQGLPQAVTFIFVVIATVLIIIGTYILITEYRRERRRRLIVIELRGLHASPDTPALDKVVPAFRGERHYLPIDFRPQGQSERVNPVLLVERMSSLIGTLHSLSHGLDKRDVEVAVGGLAAVPALFLTGALLDDESHVHLYDWDRNIRGWRAIDGPDDLDRFQPLQETSIQALHPEVVMVVEASYAVAQDDILATFGASTQIMRLSVDKPLADRFISEKKQQEMVKQFRDTVQALHARGVKKLHLVAAVPSSLGIRMGMAYDKRLHPEIVVYQYEKGQPNPYPWGLQMPNVSAQLQIIETQGLCKTSPA